VLAAVIRAGDLDPVAEQRAVAAFRAARDAGAHRARTRRRDDWRSPAERRAGRPVKTTFAAVFASLALGGVAVAAIGSAGSSTNGTDAGRETAHPSALAPDRPGGGSPSAPSGGLGPAEGPAAAQDTEAHCRAYEQIKDSGKALDATAWQQLVAAAGGKDKVVAYCAEQLARATAAPGKPAGTGKAGKPTAGTGSGTAGKSGSSGNGTSGNGTSGSDTSGNPGGTGGTGGKDNAAGNGQTGGDEGGGKHK
jgi:hypothetical protein